MRHFSLAGAAAAMLTLIGPADAGNGLPDGVTLTHKVAPWSTLEQILGPPIDNLRGFGLSNGRTIFCGDLKGEPIAFVVLPGNLLPIPHDVYVPSSPRDELNVTRTCRFLDLAIDAHQTQILPQ